MIFVGIEKQANTNMENIIKSKDNKNIKLLNKLRLKKYRDKHKLFKVENFKIIKDALKSDYFFKSIFFSKSFVKKNKNEYGEILNNFKEENVFLVDDKIFDYFSELDSSSGVIALYDFKRTGKITDNRVIYLNGVSDPGNLGTIIRTMIAFGFSDLVLDEKCADIYNLKTISAAKEAIFKVNFIKDKNKSWIKNCRLPIYAADSNKGEDFRKIKIKDKFCLVFGSEGGGVDKEILSLSKKRIKIKISKEIESLNVAIAAGIILEKF
jgi:TrmH family RNA methyltransferase